MKTTLFQSGVEDTWGIVLTFKWRRVLRRFGNIPWRYFVSGGKMILQHTEERGWNEWGVFVALLNEFTEIFVYNFFEGFCWEGNEFHPITFLQMSNYKPKRSTPMPFIKWLCFTCVTLSSVQKVYMDIINTTFLHVPLIFLFLHREMLSPTRGPGLLVINTIYSSNTVIFPSTTFFAETTASSKIATWKAMRLNDVALNYWTSRQTQRIKPLISLILRGRVHALH